MKLATNNSFNNPSKVGVLLDFGRYSNSFDYLDSKNLGTEIGDIVLVRLKGRLCSGLVVEKKISNLVKGQNLNFDEKKDIKYLFVESIIQKKVFEPWWRDWIENLASMHKVSNFKMFKTALPPGWIGKYNQKTLKSNNQLWITASNKLDYSPHELTDKQSKLFKFMELKAGFWQSELNKLGFTSALINVLVKKKLLKKIKKERPPSLSLNSYQNDFGDNKIPQLTNQQREAYDQIQAMEPGESILLWGETGSGKTEVYLRVVQEQLSVNKSCLILAPEIGLIPQLIDRFTTRFKKNIFEYHSNCSTKHRKLVWNKILSSVEPIIVIGTRSAVFLPIKELGIIILDEEHDDSYKQESPMPCYDARELSFDRAKKNKAKLIFGSATPSLSIWKKFYFDKKIRMIRMQDRISSTKEPDIEIVDMREEFKNGNKKILSEELIRSLDSLREKKEQAIILIPRRGYSGFLSCRNCGYIVNCPHCDLALTVHIGSKGTNWLSCHWCNFKRTIINTCPDCNSNAFKSFGIGTQRVVKFLNDELPNLKLFRFDRDTTSGKDGHRRILSDFSKGHADVLVGTQMIAKGIDIPNVTLSVVIAADGLLHRPDLSSEENALQLFLQLAGRSGRDKKSGKVIIQTYQPQHPVISYLRQRNYEGFLNDNSKLRKESGLFPFCKVCLLKISGINYDLTELAAKDIARYLSPFCVKKSWKLIGPAPSMISKIGKKFRWQILIYGADNSELPIPEGNKLWDILPNDTFLTVDINPVEI